jgi:hypothetical protein
MKGDLIQINNVDDESIGVWYTEEVEILSNNNLIVDWFRSYANSDMYNEKGVDGFVAYVKQIGYNIERVFINMENL